MGSLIDFILHIDRHLKEAIDQYHSQVYWILFGIVFAETGFVVTPFLPGDSLLFATGIFAHPEQGPLSLPLLYLTFIAAALLGDNVNYQVGRLFGHKLFRNESSRIFKKSHLERTHAFMERHGPKTIIIARFVPIVRTFAPFVAGMGDMAYLRFLLFSFVGACLWVGLCVTAGYLFGAIPIVQRHFSLAMLGVVAISLIPALIEWWRHRIGARKEAQCDERQP